jgi:hypothetical protein
MRAVLVDGEVICHLVMAKTRLMQLKTISIPRAAGLSASCASRKNHLRTVRSEYASCYILIRFNHGDMVDPRRAAKFPTIVANRVAEVISENDPGQWHYVRTDLNVADIATRGVA